MHAAGAGAYACFLQPDTALPFMYMPDCLAATYALMFADNAALTQVTLHLRTLPVEGHAAGQLSLSAGRRSRGLKLPAHACPTHAISAAKTLMCSFLPTRG